MTLSFSQKLNGKPTHFVEKIYVGMYDMGIVSISKIAELAREPLNPVPEEWQRIDTLRKAWGIYKGKLHTIREDKTNRWREDRPIKFVINNRSKNLYQFLPLLPCVSVQQIEIRYTAECNEFPMVFIDGKAIHELDNHESILQALAVNDGFEDIDGSFNYFDKSFTGKLIHWTNLKY